MNPDKFSLNGKIKPITEATISITNIEYAYGFGVYETIRVIKGAPYFLNEHAERLLMSSKIIGLDHNISGDNVKRYVGELIKQLDSSEAYNLKILLIGAKDPNDCMIYIFPSKPLFPEKKIQRDGVEILTVQYERPFPNAKTLNMLQSYMAFQKAKRGNCYDALAVDRNGYITEGTMTNFFLIKDKVIFTPPKNKILDGVTKKIVLGLAIKNGFKVEEKCATIAALSEYEGAFLTSTSSKIMPIRKIDNFTFPSISENIKILGSIYEEFLSTCAGVFE